MKNLQLPVESKTSYCCTVLHAVLKLFALVKQDKPGILHVQDIITLRPDQKLGYHGTACLSGQELLHGWKDVSRISVNLCIIFHTIDNADVL